MLTDMSDASYPLMDAKEGIPIEAEIVTTTVANRSPLEHEALPKDCEQFAGPNPKIGYTTCVHVSTDR